MGASKTRAPSEHEARHCKHSAGIHQCFFTQPRSMASVHACSGPWSLLAAGLLCGRKLWTFCTWGVGVTRAMPPTLDASRWQPLLRSGTVEYFHRPAGAMSLSPSPLGARDSSTGRVGQLARMSSGALPGAALRASAKSLSPSPRVPGGVALRGCAVSLSPSRNAWVAHPATLTGAHASMPVCTAHAQSRYVVVLRECAQERERKALPNT